MSMGNLMAFVEATLQDSGFVAELSAVVKRAGHDSTSAVSAFATTKGFEVAAKDVAALRAGMKSNMIANGVLESAELDDSELELIAGGSQFPPDDWFNKFPKAETHTDSSPQTGSGWDFPICVMPTPTNLKQLGLL
jgi:hypothetical protein